MEFRDEKQATKMRKQAIKSQIHQAAGEASPQTASLCFYAFLPGWAGAGLALKNSGFRVVC
jgi:hypothetical protein